MKMSMRMIVSHPRIRDPDHPTDRCHQKNIHLQELNIDNIENYQLIVRLQSDQMFSSVDIGMPNDQVFLGLAVKSVCEG